MTEIKCNSRDSKDGYIKWLTSNRHWDSGDALTLVMRSQGYSDQGLATELNVSIGAIRSWRYNINGPNAHNFKKLCKILDVKPEYFLEPTLITKITKRIVKK